MINYKLILYFAIFVALFVFRRFLIALPELVYWWFRDIKNFDRELFRPFGCWFYVGKQGSGKSMSLIYQLERLRRRYPKCKIYTNMGYRFETAPLKSLNDLLNRDLYNGKYGTIFVIDEIQNEFSCQTSKDFPETLLSLITQQRKNRILILTTSQIFTRVSKPIREQCYRAIECQTFSDVTHAIKFLMVFSILIPLIYHLINVGVRVNVSICKHSARRIIYVNVSILIN